MKTIQDLYLTPSRNRKVATDDTPIYNALVKKHNRRIARRKVKDTVVSTLRRGLEHRTNA